MDAAIIISRSAKHAKRYKAKHRFMKGIYMEISFERRKCEYREFGTNSKQIGFCLLITGGMYGPPVAVIERHDGTMATIPTDDVQFLDIVPWNNID